MDYTTIIIILGITILVLLILLLVVNSKNKALAVLLSQAKNASYTQEDYDQWVIDKTQLIADKDAKIDRLKAELLQFKEDFLIEKNQAYHTGVQDGIKQSGYEIQVHPYQKAISEKTLFGSKEMVEIGYKYLFMINGVPALTSHTEIIETLSKKDIDEGKVEQYIDKILEVVNALPLNKGKLIGDLATFGKKLLTQGKK